MICPKCGTVNDETYVFCANCGESLNIQPSVNLQRMNKSKAVVAVIVVVAIMIIASIAIVALNGSQNNGQISITPKVAAPFDQNPDGSLIIQVVISLNNGKSSTVYPSLTDFTLLASDGLDHYCSYNIGINPSKVDGGSSALISLGFIVSSTTVPISITYSDVSGTLAVRT